MTYSATLSASSSIIYVINTGGIPPGPTNSYVTEDGLIDYVAEDGTTYYVQETPGGNAGQSTGLLLAVTYS